MKKSIAILREYSGYGGIEHQIEMIAANLKKKGWHVVLITDRESPMSKTIFQNQIDVVYLGNSNLLKKAVLVKKICKEHEVSILQSHMLYESFIGRLVKLIHPKIKHIYRIHTYIDCSHIPMWKKNLYHVACRMTDCLVTRYCSINEYNVREMTNRTHLPKRKISVIHNAVRLEKPNLQPPAEFALNNHIAMIANFVDFKGHDVLLDGLKILRERGYRLTAHLIGAVPGFGTENENRTRYHIVKDTIRNYRLEEQVVIHGYSSNIEEAVKDCCIVVLPSDSEGTPNVLLEGMVLHKIIVASKVGGVPEFVTEGQTGFLHQPKDPASFADAMERAYETPKEQLFAMLVNAKRLAEGEYSIRAMMEGFDKEYKSLEKVKEGIIGEQ